MNVNLGSIYSTKEHSDNDVSLVLWLSEVMIKDVGCDGWVDEAVERLHCESEVQVGQFAELRCHFLELDAGQLNSSGKGPRSLFKLINNKPLSNFNN